METEQKPAYIIRKAGQAKHRKHKRNRKADIAHDATDCHGTTKGKWRASEIGKRRETNKSRQTRRNLQPIEGHNHPLRFQNKQINLSIYLSLYI